MTRSPPPRNLLSDYMNFAKLHTAAKYGLASSGVADCAMADLDPKPEDFVLHGRNSYGREGRNPPAWGGISHSHGDTGLGQAILAAVCSSAKFM